MRLLPKTEIKQRRLERLVSVNRERGMRNSASVKRRRVNAILNGNVLPIGSNRMPSSNEIDNRANESNKIACNKRRRVNVKLLRESDRKLITKLRNGGEMLIVNSWQNVNKMFFSSSKAGCAGNKKINNAKPNVNESRTSNVRLNKKNVSVRRKLNVNVNNKDHSNNANVSHSNSNKPMPSDRDRQTLSGRDKQTLNGRERQALNDNEKPMRNDNDRRVPNDRDGQMTSANGMLQSNASNNRNVSVNNSVGKNKRRNVSFRNWPATKSQR